MGSYWELTNEKKAWVRGVMRGVNSLTTGEFIWKQVVSTI